jgi:hypothetical protein
MAEILAILQGKESRESLKLSDSFIAKYYDSAMELYLNDYIAIKTESGYEIKKHTPMWIRRIR